MSSLRSTSTRARNLAQRTLKARLVSSRRVPRYAYRHYFIETEGLHSRIQMQNFYSAMWAQLDEPVEVRVELFDASGASLGVLGRRLPPFGGLFLEIRDALSELGVDAPEGTVVVDAAPPAAVIEDLTSFPLAEPGELVMGTPFWMAYYDERENYMYVHAISPEMGAFRGIPAWAGRFLISDSAGTAGRWRAGRIIDVRGLDELQVVLVNHARSTRATRLGFYAASDGSAVWERPLELGPHEVQRVRVPVEAIDAFRSASPDAGFRVGLDPLPTSNGKPYLLMRYGDGPLSLHHG